MNRSLVGRMLLVVVVGLFLWSSPAFRPLAFAHPGNTASDGCHYCRTNCEQWGVPANQRHCHGGADPAPQNPAPPEQPQPQPRQPEAPIQPQAPPPTPQPTPVPTPQPTPESTEAPTLEPLFTPERTDPPSDEAGAGGVAVLALLGLAGGAGWYLVRRQRNSS